MPYTAVLKRNNREDIK